MSTKLYYYISNFILVLILLVCIYQYNANYNNGLDNHALMITSMTSVIIFLIYMISPSQPFKKKGISFFKITTFFLLSYFIVHFSNYLHYTFKTVDLRFLESHSVNKAAILSLCCFISLILGIRSTNNPFYHRTSVRFDWKTNDFLSYIFLVALCLFYGFTDKRFFTSGGNYEILNNIGWHPLGQVGNSLCIAAVLASIISVYFRCNEQGIANITFKEYLIKFPLKFYFLLFLYLGLILISGDRGPMIDIGVAFVSNYFIVSRKKIKFLQLIILVIIASFALTFLAYLRANPDNLSIDKVLAVSNRLKESNENTNGLYNITKDLSNVVDSYHLVYFFTESYGIIYGLGAFFQIIGILPGIRSIIYNMLGLDISILSTDVIATNLLGEEHGAGTTCVADTFYNFGLYGTLLIFFIFGKLIKKLELSLYSYSGSLFVIVVAFSYLTKAIYLGRSSLFQPMNLIAYTFLCLFLSTIFLNRGKSQ